MGRVKQRYVYSLILIRELVITDFKLRYQGSALGYVWSLLRPLGVFVILYFVFVRFLRVGQDIPHFPVYLLLGIILWSYFTEVTNNGVGAIVGRGDLIRKLNFPKYVIVLAGSLSALINLALNFIVFSIFAYFNGVDIRAAIIWVPLLIAELFLLAISIAFLLSALFVRLRDVNYIWEVLMQGAFYATPILYPLIDKFVPRDIAKVIILNPMAQIIQDMRYALVTPHSPTIASIYENELTRLAPVGMVFVIAIFSMWFFRKRSKYFAEEV